MSHVQKYNSILNQVKKDVKKKSNKDMMYIETAQYLFDVYRQIDVLRDKEIRRYYEIIIDDVDMGIILDDILSDSELFPIIKLTKKVKKELLLCLITDIFDYIEKNECLNDFIILNENDKLILLDKTTKFVFGTKKNFIIEKPVIFKCPKNDFIKICNIIKSKDTPDNLEFNIDDMINDIHAKAELHKMINKYHTKNL